MLSDHRTNVEIYGTPLLFKLGLTGPCGVKIIQRPDRRLETRRILGGIPDSLALCRVVEIILRTCLSRSKKVL